MSKGVNKVILVGNLGQDPDVRYTASGAAAANIAVATSEQWIDRQSGQKHEKTEWHRVVLFGRLGEIAGEYLRKGSQVYIEGKLQTRKWQDQNGQDRYTTEIVANEMQMIGSSRSEAPSQPQDDASNPQQDTLPMRGGARGSDGKGGFDDFDDDITFNKKHHMEGG